MALCAQLSFRSGRAALPVRLTDPGRAGMTNRQASGLLTPLGTPGCPHGSEMVCACPCTRVHACASRRVAGLPARARGSLHHAGVRPRSRCVCCSGPAANPAAAPSARAPTACCPCPGLPTPAGCPQRANARRRSPAFGRHAGSGLPFCAEPQIIDC